MGRQGHKEKQYRVTRLATGEEHCQPQNAEGSLYGKGHQKVLQLWSQVEECSQFVVTSNFDEGAKE